MTRQSGRIQPNPGCDHTAHPVRRGSFAPVFTAVSYTHLDVYKSQLPRLLGGESCALVSDAGMPAISDPGEELVRLCGEDVYKRQA